MRYGWNFQSIIDTLVLNDDIQNENKENTSKKDIKNIIIVNNKLKTFGFNQPGSAKKNLKDSRIVIQKDTPKKRKLV